MSHLVIKDSQGGIEGTIKAGHAPAFVTVDLTDSEFDYPIGNYTFDIEFAQLKSTDHIKQRFQPECGPVATFLYPRGGEYRIRAKAVDRHGVIWSAQREVVVSPWDESRIASFVINGQIDNPEWEYEDKYPTFRRIEDALDYAKKNHMDAGLWRFLFSKWQMHPIEETFVWETGMPSITIDKRYHGPHPMLTWYGEHGKPIFDIKHDFDPNKQFILSNVVVEAGDRAGAEAAVSCSHRTSPSIVIIETRTGNNIQSLARIHPTEKSGPITVTGCKTFSCALTNWLEFGSNCALVDVSGNLVKATAAGKAIVSAASKIRIHNNSFIGDTKYGSHSRLAVTGGRYIYVSNNRCSSDAAMPSPDIEVLDVHSVPMDVMIERNTLHSPILLNGSIDGLTIRNNIMHSLLSLNRKNTIFKDLCVYHNTMIVRATRMVTPVILHADECPGLDMQNNLIVFYQLLWEKTDGIEHPMMILKDASQLDNIRNNMWPLPHSTYKGVWFLVGDKDIKGGIPKNVHKWIQFEAKRAIANIGPECMLSNLGLIEDVHGNYRPPGKVTVGAVESEPVFRMNPNRIDEEHLPKSSTLIHRVGNLLRAIIGK